MNQKFDPNSAVDLGAVQLRSEAAKNNVTIGFNMNPIMVGHLPAIEVQFIIANGEARKPVSIPPAMIPPLAAALLDYLAGSYAPRTPEGEGPDAGATTPPLSTEGREG